ncbi:MAG TPA: nuclear transport factor 2 family protein [Baekduia sp.]|nr:nuclear transport factor 2 family protein [Baekduia sp.]
MTSAADVRAVIDRYNEAWNAHDTDTIVELHAPDMVFENHTAGERAQGAAVRDHIQRIFDAWPDIRFETRRLYVREDLVAQEWTATATHLSELRRGDLVAPPSGNAVSWKGVDVIPLEDGLIKRKDVYSDSVTILRAVGLLD